MRVSRALLLCGSAVCPTADSAAHVDDLLCEKLDWPWLLGAAARHGVLPLLYSRLNARWPDKLERTALEELRKRFQRDARRNFLMSQELLAILELFAENGIPALPYKGPVLAAAEYGNIALRPFCDLDILVHKEHVPRARDLLIARQYVPEHQLEPVHEHAWLRARNDLNLRRPDLDIVVELHWEVVPRRLCVPFDDDRLWARTQTVPLGGRQVRTLSPENLLLVLCVHGAKHGWTRLIWICDIAAIVTNHADMDWADVLGEARRMGVERMVRVALRLACDVAGCVLPEAVRRFADDAPTVTLARNVRERLFAPTATGHDAFLRSLFHVKIRERLRDKVRFGLYTAFVPSAADRLLVGLPFALTVLYYLLRPFRLARKYFWRPLASGPAG